MYQVGERLSRSKDGLFSRVIQHKGIATGANTVVHACKDVGCVVEETIETFGKGQLIVSEGIPAYEQGSRSVEMARSLIGKPYDVLRDNCEHMVNLVSGHGKRSPQLETAFGGLAILCFLFFVIRQK
ncbi:lecithin retinol acyltransferase family protein [Kordiimonas laminariae]|uniref:lecithin retinol acyltransferase family protein n=1 Tax=Kordiimonas laminariae TaxID=2917717 RepID=UPI001FF20427|nr:lecithin retinol acyltransferase family protein [Kordiimonas laminariae]MCK0070864.1 lecithin retinol acyltransferase family protein [Kordiimonas laminariae]